MLNYFDLFNLPQRYALDENELTVRYLSKQKKAHSAGDNVSSSVLNIAYSTLKNPLQRAEYLLSLQGKNLDTMPKNLAVKMFDLREKFEKMSDSDRENFLKDQNQNIDNLLGLLNNYSLEDETFFKILCEAKFLHSFLEKVKNVNDRH